MSFASETLAFFVEHFPTPAEMLLAGPPSLLWAWAGLHVSGLLKRRLGLATGYTRKLFHFVILCAAAVVQSIWGLSVLFVFGAATSAVIFAAIWQGEGAQLYEAIAREADSPKRTHFIVVAYLATLIGGLLCNLLFGMLAIAGYLVTGLADAVAEPVGTRFGRHTYRVPSFAGVSATRSLEGSCAVFVASAGAFLLAGLLLPQGSVQTPGFAWLLVMAVVCTAVEAVSPHGWDNATLQIAATWLYAVIAAVPGAQ